MRPLFYPARSFHISALCPIFAHQPTGRMHSKKHITLIFLVACIAMMVANALPHHHHRTAACFTISHETQASCPAPQSGSQEKAPCHMACITKFHCCKSGTARTAQPSQKTQASPAGMAAVNGNLPYAPSASPTPPYRERLHPSDTTTCRNPRGPPTTL